MCAKSKITNKQLRSIDRGVLRDNMKADGVYDGRFRSKVIPNKKKNQPPQVDENI